MFYNLNAGNVMTKQYPTQHEDDKYSELYNNHYREGDPAFIRINYCALFVDFHDKTIIEFGCGRGQLRQRLPHKSYIGVDVASTLKKNAENWKENEIFIHADIRWYQPKQKYDISISMDVLEHIEECSIDPVIQNIISAGEICILGISCRTAVITSPTGENLHLTVRPPSWWAKRIRKHGNIVHTNVSPSGHYVTFIIAKEEIMKQKMTRKTMPASIGGVRVTMTINGSYTIPRRNRVAEEYLDKIGIRCHRQLRWFLPLEGFDLDFTESVYIVGKGPSLDQLRKEHFEPGRSIFCINETIHKVLSLGLDNPLHVFSQDENLDMTCKVKGPNYIIAPKIARFYIEHPNTTIINPGRVGPTASLLTVNFAIYTGRHFGVKHFDLLCFDACVNQNTDYANCIGHLSLKGGDPKRFLNHRNMIMGAIGDATLKFIIPEALPSEVSDTLQQ